MDVSGTWVIGTGDIGGAAGTMVQIAQDDRADGCYLTATSKGATWSPAQGEFGGPPDNRFGMKFGTLEYSGIADRYGSEYSEINWYASGSIETGFNQSSVGKWTKYRPPAPPIHCPDISGTWVGSGAPLQGTTIQMTQHDHDNHCYLTATFRGLGSPAQGSFDGPPDNRFGMSFYDGRAGTLSFIGLANASQITWYEDGFDKPVGNWTKQVGSYVEKAVEPLGELEDAFRPPPPPPPPGECLTDGHKCVEPCDCCSGDCSANSELPNSLQWFCQDALKPTPPPSCVTDGQVCSPERPHQCCSGNCRESDFHSPECG